MWKSRVLQYNSVQLQFVPEVTTSARRRTRRRIRHNGIAGSTVRRGRSYVILRQDSDSDVGRCEYRYGKYVNARMQARSYGGPGANCP